MRKPYFVIAVCATLLTCSMQSNAAAVVSLSSNAANSTVYDNGAGDLNSGTGAVLVSGPIDLWNINTTTGLTKDILGSSEVAKMDLNSVDLASDGTTNALTIEFWDFGFNTTGTALFNTSIGGTVDNANISWQACVDDANGTSCTSIVSGAFNGEGGFSANDAGSTGLSGDYSIGLIATITPDGVGAVLASFDFQITQVPIPAAVWLFGSGLIGLVGVARRKNV